MSTITTLNDGITGASFRGTTNMNFSNLNTDKAELSGGTFTGDISVPAEVYGAGWNGSNEVPTKNDLYDKIETISGGGATTFLGLTDTPSSYSGQAGKFPKVNVGETALEFVTVSGGGDMLASTYDPANIAQQVVGTTATQTISGKTLTAPKFADNGFIADSNGNEMVSFNQNASAVNYLEIENGATGNPPHLRAMGDDADIGLHLVGKGTGEVSVCDATDETKRLRFGISNNGTGIITTLRSNSTGSSKTIDLPNATDTLVGKATTDTLTNKDISSATNTYRSASDTVVGAVELATIAETNTGTDATRALTPDGLAGSNFGIRYVACSLNGTTALTTSDKAYFRIPSAFTGMNLVSVSATVGTGASGSSSSGVPTFTVKNVTDGNQMLSTSLTVDASEYTSATAATPAVINASFDDVVTDDLIEVACTVAGTGVTYATILVGFQLP